MNALAIEVLSVAAIEAVRADVLAHLHEWSEANRLYTAAATAPDLPFTRVRARWDRDQLTAVRLAAQGGEPDSGSEADILARAAQLMLARDFQAFVRQILALPASPRGVA